jgi:isocitrate lyase
MGSLFQPVFKGMAMTLYQKDIADVAALCGAQGDSWNAINPESVARMRAQNRFKTGIDVAKYTAKIMRSDMDAYDGDSSKYTQSLGCWHGFIAQQKMIAIKKHMSTTKGSYIYLSGWMIAALRSEFGPLPDQSMHEKTTVPELIEEIYTYLRQADARELGGLFRELDAARAAGDSVKEKGVQNQIDNFETHVVPIIADIDAGFGNEEATYLLAKKEENNRSRCLLHSNRKPGVRCQAMRPPGRQGYRAACRFHCQDQRRALCLSRTGCR